MKIKYEGSYEDFDGEEHGLQAELSIEIEKGVINEQLGWEEKKAILRVGGKIIGRKSLCYREVAR